MSAETTADVRDNGEYQVPGWAGELVLSCGHGWPGECDTKEDAERFLAMCVATADRAPCQECGEMKTITGPLREVVDAT